MDVCAMLLLFKWFVFYAAKSLNFPLYDEDVLIPRGGLGECFGKLGKVSEWGKGDALLFPVKCREREKSVI